MKQILPLILFLFIISSCKSKKRYTNTKRQIPTINVNTTYKPSKRAVKIVNHAKTYKGTRYKYGGNTRRGIDCSGLIHNSFKANNINIPRTTTDLKTTGTWIDIKEVTVGDLLFFATTKHSRKITHVGIVTNVKVGNIEFIHASSSKGVTISSLAERYWYFAFVQARRVL